MTRQSNVSVMHKDAGWQIGQDTRMGNALSLLGCCEAREELPELGC